MSEHANDGARPADPAGRVLFAVARFLAVAGGAICFAMALLITISVTGRYLIAMPIPGDYDLVAILSGCAVFAFLPYCQMVHGNVVVDFFTADIAPKPKAILDAAGNLFYLLIAVLFTWRFVYGALELRANGEVLANFNFYRWWTTPFNIACMIVLIVTIAYTLLRDLGDVSRAGSGAPPAVERKPQS